MAEGAVRPTQRCLEELGVEPPSVDVPLSAVDADPVPQAQALPERFEAGGATRIVSLRDRVWFKVKTSRWRGAAVHLTDAELEAEASEDLLHQRPCRITAEPVGGWAR